MREAALPKAAGSPATGSSVAIVADAARTAPKHPAVLHRRSGRREVVSLRALLDEVRTIAAGIAAAGVQPGERVALMAQPSASGLVATLACWYAGAVVVPLDPAGTEARTEWALSESGAVAVFVDEGDPLETLAAIAADVPNVGRRWPLRDDALDELAALGTVVGEDDLEARRGTAGPGDPAVILYGPTAGGDWRGSVLSHRALQYAADTIADAVAQLPQPGPTGPAVVALPATHLLSQVVALGFLRAGVAFAFGTPGAEVLGVLDDWQPTLLATDPFTLERAVQAAVERERADGRPWVLDAAAAAARLALLDRAPTQRLPSLLGGRLSAVMCGGATLGPTLRQRLRAAEIAVRQIIGPPQACGLIAVGEPSDDGWIGPPPPGTQLRILDDEILVRGPQVFAGYFNDRRATDTVITEDGWLHTGLCGDCDAGGNVRVTGRIDDIVVTSSGIAVAVGPLEEQLRAAPLIAQCLVVGDGLPHLIAAVQLDPAEVRAWQAVRHGSAAPGPSGDDPDIIPALQAVVAAVNASLAPGEWIGDCYVLPDPLPEGGLLPAPGMPRRAIAAQVSRIMAADSD
jgi:long-chain acyl-CoA synthetase